MSELSPSVGSESYEVRDDVFHVKQFSVFFSPEIVKNS